MHLIRTRVPLAVFVTAFVGGLTACSGDDSSGATTVTDAGSDATTNKNADAGGAGGDSGAVIADAASDASETSDAATTSSVTLHFKGKVGTADFACNTQYPNQGATAVTVEPRDFRFYVSNVFLVDEAGNKVPVTLDTRSPWQTPDLALIDFENGTGACAAEGTPETNDTITGRCRPAPTAESSSPTWSPMRSITATR